MIKFSEDTIGVWYVQIPEGDWLASIFKEDGKPCLVYRFRYYVDDKSFDSDDEKNWYKMEPKDGDADLDKLIETTRMVAGLTAARADSEVYELMMKDFDDSSAFFKEFQKAPFVSIQEEKLH